MRNRQTTSPPSERKRRAAAVPDRSPARDDAAPDSGPSRSTRSRILTAAERLFAEDGFGNVSMPAIASASGITAGAIYRHFESKDDLFFEVVRRAVQSVPMPVPPGSPSDATSLPLIVALYTTPGLKLLRQLAIETHYASARSARVRRLLRRSLAITIAQLCDAIVSAREAGKLDFTGDPTLLASTVMVFIMGLMHMESLLPQHVGDPQWQDFVRARVATLLGIPESNASEAQAIAPANGNHSSTQQSEVDADPGLSRGKGRS